MKFKERERYMLETGMALVADIYMRNSSDVLEGLLGPRDLERRAEYARQLADTALLASQLSEMFARLPEEDREPEDSNVTTLPTVGVLMARASPPEPPPETPNIWRSRKQIQETAHWLVIRPNGTVWLGCGERVVVVPEHNREGGMERRVARRRVDISCPTCSLFAFEEFTSAPLSPPQEALRDPRLKQGGK